MIYKAVQLSYSIYFLLILREKKTKRDDFVHWEKKHCGITQCFLFI